MIKLEIPLPKTATKFLSSYGLKIQDYDDWHDEKTVNRCLIIKSKLCSTSFKKKKDFDAIFAPNLEEMQREQFFGTVI